MGSAGTDPGSRATGRQGGVRDRTDLVDRIDNEVNPVNQVNKVPPQGASNILS